MIKCLHCNSDLIWGNDFDADEVGYEFEGIVSVYSCNQCNGLFELIDNFTNNSKFIYVVPVVLDN